MKKIETLPRGWWWCYAWNTRNTVRSHSLALALVVNREIRHHETVYVTDQHGMRQVEWYLL